MDTKSTRGRIYTEDYKTLLHTKYESSGTQGFLDEDCVWFSHGKYMRDNDPLVGAILNPKGIIGKIYVKHHITLLHTGT